VTITPNQSSDTQQVVPWSAIFDMLQCVPTDRVSEPWPWPQTNLVTLDKSCHGQQFSSVLQGVLVGCCSVLQWVAVFAAVCCSVLQCVAIQCCSVLQCVAVRCSALCSALCRNLPCAAVRCSACCSNELISPRSAAVSNFFEISASRLVVEKVDVLLYIFVKTYE